MMKIIKFILFLALIITMGNLSKGYQNQTRVEQKVQKLKEFLTLTDEQAAQVKSILSKVEQQTAQENKSKSINKRAIPRNSRARISASDKEIEALLTPEQLRKYESYKKERQSEMLGRSKGRKYRQD